MNFEVVEVCWLDSEAMDDGWRTIEDFDEFASDSITPIVSVGLAYRENSEYLVLVQSISRHCVNGHIKIPVVAIVSKDVLGSVTILRNDS